MLGYRKQETRLFSKGKNVIQVQTANSFNMKKGSTGNVPDLFKEISKRNATALESIVLQYIR